MVKEKRITWLRDHYNALTLNENSPEEVKLWKTRMYILFIYSCLLFPDSNGNTIHLQFLPLLADINKIGSYSWSVAALSHLYKKLCRCAKKM